MNKAALVFASCREELDRNQKKIHNKCNKNWFLCIKLYRKEISSMFLMGLLTTMEEAVAYDKMSDEKLLLRVAEGDKAAFQQLYQNTDKLYTVLFYRFCGIRRTLRRSCRSFI